MISYGRAAAVINLSHIANNIRVIRKMIAPKTRIMAVVKANGYGHGIYEAAWAAIDAGAEWAGVATVPEGVILRRRGIDAPILVLSPAFEEDFEDLLTNNLVATIFSLDTAKKLADAAKKLGKTAKVHIKTDTGMNRIGYNVQSENACDATAKEIMEISRLEHIEIDGIYSHFATSDSDAAFAGEQFALFMNIIGILENHGLHIPIKHISNSGATLYPEFNLDMVRCGVLTYGLAPNSLREGSLELARLGFLPALTLKSRVSHIKTVEKGQSVGYSRNFFAKADMQVATVPLGYADGVSRQLSNKGRVLINGIYCNIIGNVCMDQFMVDVSGVGAKVRDEVIIVGQSGDERIWAEDVAALQKTICNEIATSIAERVARYYIT